MLDWGGADLLFGLLAECCNVELTQIVSGRVAQCAFPDDEHECRHDVSTDVFARLRLLSVSVGWSIRDAEKAKRKQLIKRLVGSKH